VDRLQRDDVRDLLVRVVAPGLALLVLIVGIGLTLKTDWLAGFTRAEETANRGLAAHRTSTMNTVTLAWSYIGNTNIIGGACVVVVVFVLWRTRDWRLAVFPAIAIVVQLSIFLTAASLVDRRRPTVVKLDVAPPTSSYPSGHVGASTALYCSFALLALRIQRTWLRRTTVSVCLAVPLLVAFGRLYRGMHHVSDVAVGLANGLLCALLAYGWYRRRTIAGRDRPRDHDRPLEPIDRHDEPA
jgi:membrane-associated phospholipid phosphatase